MAFQTALRAMKVQTDQKKAAEQGTMPKIDPEQSPPIIHPITIEGSKPVMQPGTAPVLRGTDSLLNRRSQKGFGKPLPRFGQRY